MVSKLWKLLGSRPDGDHRIFTVRKDRYRLEDSAREREFVVLEMPDWVHVVPVTREREAVLIRQFRHGVRLDTLEIPGGMVDPGESPAEAAARELREESGYRAGRLTPIGATWPNPAIQSNTIHAFLAEECVLEGAPAFDDYERIEVELVPLDEIPRLIREGTIRHALVVLAFGLIGHAHEERRP